MNILFDALESSISGERKPVVAVCVPAKDQMHSTFSYCLSQMLLYSQTMGIECKLFFNLGTLIVNQRESLAKDALDIDATHVLWLDSDMAFPANTLERLLAHKVPVVAANYAQRRSPVKSVAFEEAREWESYLVHYATDSNTFDEKQVLKGLVEVEAVGMGCMLVETKIYKILKKPYFQLIWDEDAQDHHGEDMYHCSKIIAQGTKILIDADISTEIRHCGEYHYKLEMVTKPPRYY